MDAFDLAGTVRRIRRAADLSQRQLADACGVAQSVIAQAEGGRRGLQAAVLGRAAAVAGLRLALLDGSGTEIPPMRDDAVRDGARRRFPAHLDTRYGDEDWWHGRERYSREQPWYTFDRSRRIRDSRRDATGGAADDHQELRAGDSPDARSRARRAETARRRVEELQRRLGNGDLPPVPPWVCDCPPGCAELEDWEGPPRHVDDCACRCDPC